MKNNFKIFALLMVIGLWSCEKNDPLGDQGELTGRIFPFNLLAQMPDAAAGDTLNLRTVCWAIDDDIESVTFYHSGFKVRDYDVKMQVPITGAPAVQLATAFREDSIIVPSTLFASYPEEGSTLNAYYQTYENAYVVTPGFVVPEVYALSKLKDKPLILAMPESIFNKVVADFSIMFDRSMVISVFPEVSPYSPLYFEIDNEGYYTGNLTAAGTQYVVENLSRERMNSFLKEASVADNTRATIESKATVKGTNASASSKRSFKVL